MNTPDDLVIRASIASPDMRTALELVAAAFVDADGAIGPSRSVQHGPRPAGKPGSKAPSGNPKAVRLCKWLMDDARTIASKVDRLYREMDPDECVLAKERRALLAEYRQRERETRITAHLAGKLEAAFRPEVTD